MGRKRCARSGSRAGKYRVSGVPYEVDMPNQESNPTVPRLLRVNFVDGFEDALLGTGTQFNLDVAVYNYDKCIDILMRRDGMNRKTATEFMETNICGSYVGSGTPVFIRDFAHWKGIK